MATNQQGKLGVVVNCNVGMSINGTAITAENIIDFIKTSAVKKHVISYDEGTLYSYTDPKGVAQRKLATPDKIDDEIDNSGIYFILSYEEDKLLYVGKSKNIKQRLKNHLIQCNVKTYSHIEDVSQHLCDRQSKKLPLKIKYCAIRVDDSKYNATVEGTIIDYILSHPDDPFFSECWNKRED